MAAPVVIDDVCPDATISSSGVFFRLITLLKVSDSANLSADDFTQRCDWPIGE